MRHLPHKQEKCGSIPQTATKLNKQEYNYIRTAQPKEMLMTAKQNEDLMLTALGQQNRQDFYDAHGREGSPQELKQFYFEFGGGKEQFGED